MNETVFVTGGGGYVGSALVPKLLNAGYRVRVLDLFIFGEDIFPECYDNLNLEIVKGDIRDRELIKSCLKGADHVIHLACISNDPSFELNPTLGKSINYDSFQPLVEESLAAGVKRFIYASSSSVYGISDQPNVTEDHILNPLTDYSKYKALCEDVLREYICEDFVPVIIRPATVCGYAPRLRLDLTVNILTNHAYHRGAISVFGGSQLRPNIHIDDITRLYVDLLKIPADKVRGKTFNAGYQNHKVEKIARIVKEVVENRNGNHTVEIETVPTDDNRSYHICSEKIFRELGYTPAKSIEDAVYDLLDAFERGLVKDPLENPLYFNVKTLKKLEGKLL